jgi:membrane associated rhomboid family serine protease
MDERTGTTVCYRHPDRPTRLACTECERPICVECSRDAAVGQKCPECARPTGRHRVVDARRRIGTPTMATAPVSFGIIIIAVGVFLLGMLSPAFERETVIRFAQFNPAISAGEWWRVLTSAFLHANLTHILFNMYALYLFGPRLEQQVGSIPFAGMYFASAAGGGALSYLLGPANGLSVGASGAIFGLFGAWLFVSYRIRHTPAGRAMFNQLGILLAINMALPLIIRNIDWRAHAGGLLVGVAVAALWAQFAAGKPDAERNRTITAGAVLVLILLAVMLLA